MCKDVIVVYKRWLRQYLGLFILGVLLIAAYRLFDNFMAIGKIILELKDILLPFIIGAVLAYFLGIPAVGLERFILKKSSENSKWRKNARAISVLITFVLFLFIVTAVLCFGIPVISDNVGDFIDRAPVYLRQVNGFFRNLKIKYGVPNYYSLVETKVLEYLTNMSTLSNLDVFELVGQGINVVSTALSVLMAVVVCPYLMIERTNLLRIFDNVMLTMISLRDLRLVHRAAQKIHTIFANFIYGKAVDSLIIGIIAYVGFMALDLRFAILFAMVVGVTNMIPYFGPFFGGVPVALIAVLTDGLLPGIWTGVFIFALQQFDGLILGPYILGDAVGVSALWIIFAVTFFGGTMGFIGMVIGVPLIATIRMFYKYFIRIGELRGIIQKYKLLD